MTPAGDALTVELVHLMGEVNALPHGPACPGGRGCWCPLSDVRDLLADRLRALWVGGE